jgi:hypothetical protein
LESNGARSEWIPIDLLELNHRMVLQSSTSTLFGEIEPLSLEKDFQLFDDSFHYFYGNIPRRLFAWVFPEELKARYKLNVSWLKTLHPSRELELMQARKNFFRAILTGFRIETLVVVKQRYFGSH